MAAVFSQFHDSSKPSRAYDEASSTNQHRTVICNSPRSYIASDVTSEIRRFGAWVRAKMKEKGTQV